jgi:[calcium/calmodulin-dependent protein kinase] kinase
MLRRNNVVADHVRGHFASHKGFNLPLAREMTSSTGEYQNSLNLIRQEIAIMKKLNHPNVVTLIEVLDDPSEDLLYMVLEMCKKGVVMKVGLGERADPYDMERCRLWFRDMILGVEYRSFSILLLLR